MQRMIQTKTLALPFVALVVAMTPLIGTGLLHGQAPMVRQADADFDASGYVTPAGMVPPSMYHGSVQPVGYCDAAPCDTCYGDAGYGAGGCDSCGPSCGGGCGFGSCLGLGGGCGQSYGGCDSCGGACGPLGCGGILGKMTSGGGGLSPLRHLCCFCRGGGCSACQYVGRGYLLGALQALRPYGQAGLCAQRWYDLSAEALFLGRTSPNIGPNVITRQGVPGPNGTPVLTASDIVDGGIESGVRLSAALIFGAGGNLEVTYMGGHEWNDSATARSQNPDLFSFITDFGIDPVDLDDVDRSLSQSASFRSSFHSGELNYRRRTVGPYCRFQGSWLMGLRYFRYDDRFALNIVGETDDGVLAGPQDDILRFFNGSDRVKNDLLGAQLGGDLWWNMIPGVNLGVAFKGAWLNNEVSNSTNFAANSINAGAPGSFANTRRIERGTMAGELQFKLAYRLSHSWTFRSAYYLIAIDDIAHSNLDGDFIVAAAPGLGNPDQPSIQFDSLTLQGFSFGAEYLW